MNIPEFVLEMCILSFLGYLYFLYQKKRLLYFQQIEDFISLIDSLPDLNEDEQQLRTDLDLFLTSRKKLTARYLNSCLNLPLRTEIKQTIQSFLA